VHRPGLPPVLVVEQKELQDESLFFDAFFFAADVAFAGFGLLKRSIADERP